VTKDEEMEVAMFKELVENSGDIIVVTDAEYRIRYVSSSVSSLFSRDPVTLVDRSIFEFINSDQKERWKEAMKGQTHFHGEEAVQIGENDAVYFDVSVSNMLNRYPVEGLVLKLHNITEKKNREIELVKSNKQLDQIIFKTIHDLKAPLMSAIGLVDIAERAAEKEREGYMKLIRKSLLSLDSLIEEMNDFFRNDKTAVQREQIDLRSLIETELSNLKTLMDESGIAIALEIHHDNEFYSDPVRVRTVISNILSNAVKYYDPQKNQPFVNISVTINEDICIIKMKDNGIGIDPKYQEKIFDLFFRATDQSQGTGLGLFIVKDTVEKLKGKIEVKSEVGRGTEFTINVPNQIYQPATVE
jgi:PAS domain S-box-containing protein